MKRLIKLDIFPVEERESEKRRAEESKSSRIVITAMICEGEIKVASRGKRGCFCGSENECRIVLKPVSHERVFCIQTATGDVS